ncbi:MAG: PAS domain S-box protein [Bacteroidales bacterium]|nr:PAS domain S-box protein [Bacteroidales bacterium]
MKEEKNPEKIFDQFFSNSIDLLCIADMQGYFRKLNPEWERTLGYSLSELEGKKFIEFVHPEDVENTVEATVQLANNRQVHNFINRYRHKDGSYRWIEWRSFPAEEMIYASAHDITEQKKTEEALKESEERNRLISSLVADYVFKFEVDENKNLNLTYISENFRELTGRTTDEAKDISNWANIFYPEDLPKVQQFIQQMLSDARPGELECRSLTKGRIRWISIYAKPGTDETTGRVISITGAVKDISGKKAAETELRQSEEKFRSIVEHSLAGIFTIDENFRFIYVNDELCKIAGYSHDAIIGMDFRKLLSPKSLEMVVDRYRRRQKGEVVPHRYEIDIIRGDGEIRQAEMMVNVIKNSEGKPRSMGQLIDITERKKTENDLRESEFRLRSFIEESLEGVVIINEKGLIEEWNQKAETITDLSRDKAINQYWWHITYELLPPERRTIISEKQLENAIKEILKTGKITSKPNDNYAIKHPDGVIKYIEQKEFTIKTETGYRIAGILTDITDKIQTEASLEQARMFNDALLESTPGLVYIYDEKGNLVSWNKRHETETGYDAGELAHMNLYDWFKDEIKKTTKNKIKDFSAETVMNYEAPIIKKNGDEVLYYFSTVTTMINGKKYYVGIGLDISEQKRIENELRQFAGLHQTILDTVSVGLIYVKDRKIQWANSLFFRMYGYEYQETFEADTSMLYKSKEDYRRIGKEAYPVLAKGEIYSTETQAKKKDGSVFWVFLSGKALDPDKPEEGSIWMIQDITERRNTELALKKSEAQFRDMTQNIPGMVFQFYTRKNGDQGFNYVSDQSLKFLGIEKEKTTDFYNEFINGIAEEDRQRFFSSVQTAVNNMSRWQFEGKYVKRDGKHMYFKGIAQPKMADQEIIFDGLILDVTEKRMAEERLRESEQLYRSIVEMAPDGITLIDLTGKILMCNKQMATLLGYDDIDQVIGLKVTDVIAPELHTKLIQDSHYIQEHGHSESLRYKYVKKDGTFFTGHYRGSMIYDIDGHPVAYLGIVTDITEKEKAEEAIKQSEESLNQAQHMAKIGNMELDLDKDTGYFSDELYKLFGLDPGKGVPKFNDFIKVIHPDDRQIIINTNKPRKKTAQSLTIEYRSNPALGPVRYFLSNNEMFYDPVAGSRKLIATIQDITERKKAEAEIIKLNQELEKKVEERTVKLNEAVKDLESFAYSVSHDLRAPIRHIDGFLKLLYANIIHPNEAITGYYNKIESAAQRMSVMIDSLLTFSRLGRKELTFSEIDTDTIIHEIIELYKTDIGNRKIQWKISRLPHIHGDKNLIKLVFENLISNAVKYTSKKQKAIIEIGSTFENGQHKIFIRDNGIGFDMAYADKLFGVFQRLHNAEDYEGIGIGLANVKQIIEKHEGTIKAEGIINKGATFCLTLPKN